MSPLSSLENSEWWSHIDTLSFQTFRRYPLLHLLFTPPFPHLLARCTLPPPTTCTSLHISGWIAFLRLAATMGELFDGGSALVQVFPLWLGTWASETPHTSLCASLLTTPPSQLQHKQSVKLLHIFFYFCLLVCDTMGRCCFGWVLLLLSILEKKNIPSVGF